MTTTPIKRKPFQVVEVPECAVHDYVSFHAIIVTASEKVKGVDKNVARVREVTGGGQVLRFNVARKRAYLVGDDIVEDAPMQFTTARVDAGSKLGTVVAILNGATITGRQATLADELLGA